MKRSILILLLLTAIQVGYSQELLFDGTFDDWTFGFEGTPWDPFEIAQAQPNGELHFYAAGYNQMGMRTNKKYGNYELTLEYKWLTSAYHGNSGIWIHGQEDWAIDKGAFPTSIEVQLWKRHAGDLLRKGLGLDPEPGYPSAGEAVYRRTENGIEENLYNVWNTMTIRCTGDTILVWLNGYFINRGINVNRNGMPVTEGYITLQAEWFNIAFRNIYIKDLSPVVPVELSSFTGSMRSGNVLLEWQTASELNNLGWHVFRRADDGVYERVTDVMIPGQGSTAVPQDYAWLDEGVPGNARRISYYLQQQDVDGNTHNSAVITVQVPATIMRPGPEMNPDGLRGGDTRIFRIDGTEVRIPAGPAIYLYRRKNGMTQKLLRF